MIILHLATWWYGAGWRWIARQLFKERPAAIAHFFSITELTRTLFAPFRQDELSAKNAPLGIKLQALGGNIISRFFGVIIRLSIILVGLIMLALSAVFGLVLMLLWPFIPLAPLISIVLWLTGVTS